MRHFMKTLTRTYAENLSYPATRFCGKFLAIEYLHRNPTMTMTMPPFYFLPHPRKANNRKTLKKQIWMRAFSAFRYISGDNLCNYRFAEILSLQNTGVANPLIAKNNGFTNRKLSHLWKYLPLLRKSLSSQICGLAICRTYSRAAHPFPFDAKIPSSCMFTVQPYSLSSFLSCLRHTPPPPLFIAPVSI
jgi:hypothetical protein